MRIPSYPTRTSTCAMSRLWSICGKFLNSSKLSSAYIVGKISLSVLLPIEVNQKRFVHSATQCQYNNDNDAQVKAQMHQHSKDLLTAVTEVSTAKNEIILRPKITKEIPQPWRHSNKSGVTLLHMVLFAGIANRDRWNIFLTKEQLQKIKLKNWKI